MTHTNTQHNSKTATRNSIIDYLLQSYTPKAMPPVMSALLDLTGNSNSNISQIVNAIRQDPSIAIRVLSLANSAAYTPSLPVETIKQAVINLGVDTIRRLVLTIAVYDHVTGSNGTYNKVLLIWEHAIATALTASLLGKSHGLSNDQIDHLFMLGMFHDIGKIILHNYAHANSTQWSEDFDDKYLSISEFEKDELGITHGEVGALLLKQWSIPNSMTSIIHNHHLPADQFQFEDSEMMQYAHILNTSDILSKCLLLGVTDNTLLRSFSLNTEHLHLKHADIERIQLIVPMQTHDLLKTITKSKPPYDENVLSPITRYQNACPISPVPTCINTKPEHSAFAITCMSLSRTNAKPNFQLIHGHVKQTRHASFELPLLHRIKRGTQLPALLLTDTHHAQPATQDHIAILKTPVKLNQFIAALNTCLTSKDQSILSRAK